MRGVAQCDRLSLERCADDELVKVLGELAALALDEEEEDRPDPTSALRAIALLSEAARGIKHVPLKSYVAAHDGCARVTWEKDGARLVLSIGKLSYIYWETAASSGTVEATAENLVSLLNWLSGIQQKSKRMES